MSADALFDLPPPAAPPEVAPELPPVPVMGKATERDLLDALHARYSAASFGARRYVVAEHVRSRTDVYGALRTADFIAFACWRSDKYAIHGHEVKVSRSDWLRELKEPEKAGEFIAFTNYWWLVVPDQRIVRDGELPEGWGLMAIQGSALRAVRRAPRREAMTWTPTRLAALLRAVDSTAAYQALGRASLFTR